MDRLLELDRRRLAWGLFGLLLVGVLSLVVRPFLGTFAAAVFVYYAIRPVHRRTTDYISHPDIAAAATLLLVALPALLVLGYAAAIAVQHLNMVLSSGGLGGYRSMLKPYLNLSNVMGNPEQLLSKVGSSSGSVGSVLPTAASAVSTFFGVLMRLFLVFAFAFYFLRDDNRLSGWFYDTFGTDDGPNSADRSVVEEYANRVDDELETVYFGNLLNVVAIGALAVVINLSLGLVAPSGAGVPYPILVGLLTGVGSLVPAVGMKVVYVPVTALLFLTGGPVWFPVVYFVLMLVVVDTIPDFFVRAYISGRNLHTGLVMFSYILGSVVFGWYGIFLGPLLLVVILQFGYTVVPFVLRGKAAPNVG